MISVSFQGKLFYITVIQVYAPTTNTEEADQFYEDLEDFLEHQKKDVLFIIKKAKCRRIDAIERLLKKTPQSPFDCKEIQPVHPKGNQS